MTTTTTAIATAAAASRRRVRPGLRWALGLIAPAVLVLAWEAAKDAGLLPYSTVPAPHDVAIAFAGLVASGQLAGTLVHTLVACLGGWAIGSAIGLVIGVALGLSRTTWVYSMSSVEVLRAIPAIAFVPIAVIVFSQTLTMEIVIAAWVAIWPVAVSAMSGVTAVTPAHRELARTMRLPWHALITKIALPTALPRTFVALRLSLSAALALAIVAEIIGDPQGIGYAVVNAQQQVQPAQMFAYVLVTGLLGLALNAVIEGVFWLVAPGLRTRGGAS